MSKPATRRRTALVLGLAVGLVGAAASLTPAGGRLEEAVGLDWLFALRGQREPPPNVVVVSMDRRSQQRLDLPERFNEWPRASHAALVRALARANAAVIVFDVHFAREGDPRDDQAFATAIRDAGRIVLCEYLRKESIRSGAGATNGGTELVVERRLRPAKLFAEAAIGLAPFPLPKVPARVSQFWLFKAGDTPTLPVFALLVQALPTYDALLSRLQRLAPQSLESLPPSAQAVPAQGGLGAVAAELRSLFRAQPGLAARLLRELDAEQGAGTAAVPAALPALVAALAGPASRHMDFYGPAATIRTLPYHTIVRPSASAPAGPALDLSDTAVFVGVAEHDDPEQEDAFHTVYSRADGIDLSGVEIAATAFANLLERRPLRTPAPPLYLGLVVAWGVAVGALLRLLPGALALPSALAGSLLYLVLAHALFARSGLWLPTVVPLLVQMPLAFTGGLLWNYLDARRERQRLRHAFDYHLPSAVVDELARGDGLTVTSRPVHGVCLCTDVQGYTDLSESCDPQRLQHLINRYLETIFGPIRRQGGIVADVHGDATLSVWPGPGSDPHQRRAACLAALEVAAALHRFNAGEGQDLFATRIGVHAGEVILGHVGGLDHFEYRAVGDTVNTAARLEGLNKPLRTQILASAQTLEGVDGLCTRNLGRFVLVGKRRPLVVHELVGTLEQIEAHRLRAYQRFGQGLAAFHRRRWGEAAEAFRAVLAALPGDGPSVYYLRLCAEYAERALPDAWDGTVIITGK